MFSSVLKPQQIAVEIKYYTISRKSREFSKTEIDLGKQLEVS